jgi:AbrB family looped-hinge helix DNA binding protein
MIKGENNMKFENKRCVDELGRIVLPRDMREYYGINTGDELEIVALGDGIWLRASNKNEDRIDKAKN